MSMSRTLSPHHTRTVESVVGLHRSFRTVPTANLSVSWRFRRFFLLSLLMFWDHHCGRRVDSGALLVEGVK
jgi:hypothetical protein